VPCQGLYCLDTKSYGSKVSNHSTKDNESSKGEIPSQLGWDLTYPMPAPMPMPMLISISRSSERGTGMDCKAPPGWYVLL